MSNKEKYTEEDYQEFLDLYIDSGSLDQMERMNSRLRMPKLITRLGKDICDLMLERAKKELGDEE